MSSSRSEGLLETAGVGVAGVYLQGMSYVLACGGNLVLTAIKPRQREPCGRTGVKLQGGLRLGAGLCIVATASANFCKSGVGFCIVGIGGQGQLELTLR